MKKIILSSITFILISLMTQSLRAGSTVEFLPDKPLFSTLVAVPRQCQFQMGMRFFDEAFDNYVSNFDAPKDARKYIGISTVTAGYPLPIIQFNLPGLQKIQIGLTGGIWTLFATRYKSGPHLNSDFKVSIPVSLTTGNWTMQLSIYHISCHAGDEIIVNNPGFQRLNVSREVVDYYFIYNPMKVFKLYAGAAVLTRSDISYDLKRFYIEYGMECRPIDTFQSDSRQLFMTPFIAFNIRHNQFNNWGANLTVSLGIEFNNKNTTNNSVYRLFGEYYYGNSLEGQFLVKQTDYFSINLSYGF